MGSGLVYVFKCSILLQVCSWFRLGQMITGRKGSEVLGHQLARDLGVLFNKGNQRENLSIVSFQLIWFAIAEQVMQEKLALAKLAAAAMIEEMRYRLCISDSVLVFRFASAASPFNFNNKFADCHVSLRFRRNRDFEQRHLAQMHRKYCLTIQLIGSPYLPRWPI